MFLKNCIVVKVAITVVATPIMATIKITMPMLALKPPLIVLRSSGRKATFNSVV